MATALAKAQTERKAAEEQAKTEVESNAVLEQQQHQQQKQAEDDTDLQALLEESTQITPIPGIVLKTKSGAGEKVFINLCHHSLVAQVGASFSLMAKSGRKSTESIFVIMGEIRNTTDKNGEISVVCDALVNSKVYSRYEDATKKTVNDKVSVIQ